ncbi:aminotransferase-like domain-containing protein [Neomegalonema perideroedes]|uniref:aminotransferase-like domain-containing protein n=1 Tax=Neomegalonema perideroedes TaxID=217219 RepID=UPI00036D72C3|nr:PLP-dependent aminotransferase family protein [Neomegalonema perideroedes]
MTIQDFAAPEKAGGRTQAVMQAIRARLASRALGPGDRLPSIRGFARSLKLSPSTVVEAYDRLAAEGLIRARPGSGFYVCAGARAPLALTRETPPADRAVDPFWVSRQSLDADPEALRPGCGWLPPDWLPGEALRRALRNLARRETGLLTDYGVTRGSPALRRLLMARFAEEGLELSPDQILLTSSTTQALDLLCRLLLRPGDAVLVDDPCYFNFRALLRAHQVRAVGVPYGLSGPEPEAFEAVVLAERPRLYLTNSALHNPTGATLSAPKAHRLLKIAAAHGLLVVEDEAFADFEPEPSARLAALDGLERVIRVGGFSKTLSASLRCGYILARPDWIADLTDLQVASNFGGPSPIAAEALAELLAGSGRRKHLEALRRRLTRARRAASGRLRDLGVEPWIEPRGGFYLWGRLPEGRDSAEIARAALAEKVVFAPGDVFSLSRSAGGFMRFNVAQCEDARVYRVLGGLLRG